MKNMTVFRVSRPLVIDDLNDLNEALMVYRERELSPREKGNSGFMPPLPQYSPQFLTIFGPRGANWMADDEFGEPFAGGQFQLTHDHSAQPSDGVMITFFEETKIIAGPDVTRRVNRRVEEIQETEMRQVYKTEKAEIREAIVLSLLPHAQTRFVTVPMIFYPTGLLVVGAVGAKAENALSKLRQVLGMLPIRVVSTQTEVPMFLTRLAHAQRDGDNDTNFVITDDFQMQSVLSGENSVARLKNTDITDENIAEFMADGKAITHARLMWDNKVTFSLDPKGQIKSVRLDGTVYDDLRDAVEGEYDEAIDAYSFATVDADIRQELLVELYEAMGGIDMGQGLGDDQEATEPAILRDLAMSARNSEPDPDNPDGGDQ